MNNLQAFYKARDIGKQEENCFLNNVHKPVQWKFIDVSEIHLLDALADGAEVYSKKFLKKKMPVKCSYNY